MVRGFVLLGRGIIHIPCLINHGKREEMQVVGFSKEIKIGVSMGVWVSVSIDGKERGGEEMIDKNGGGRGWLIGNGGSDLVTMGSGLKR